MEELKTISPEGTGNLITAMLYYGIKEDDKRFFNGKYGKGVMSVFEEYTGMTYSKLKECVEIKNQSPLEYIAEDDIAKYTINELAEKYHTTTGRVRHYLRTHNKEFKRIYKRGVV